MLERKKKKNLEKKQRRKKKCGIDDVLYVPFEHPLSISLLRIKQLNDDGQWSMLQYGML